MQKIVSYKLVRSKGAPAINYQCPNCLEIHVAPGTLAGKKAACPACKEELDMPTASDLNGGNGLAAVPKPTSPSRPTHIEAELVSPLSEIEKRLIAVETVLDQSLKNDTAFYTAVSYRLMLLCRWLGWIAVIIIVEVIASIVLALFRLR